MATRWGIMSAGKISHDFTAALHYLPDTEHQVVAVAARSLESAQKLADKFHIPVAYGSYEELCKNKDIDIVYIGAIHPAHYDLCKLALAHKKNILCEKPLCMNRKRTEELLNLAKAAGVFLMEGFWSRFFPVYRRLREALANGEIGEPMVVHGNFGIRVDLCDLNARIVNKDLGGGALLDLGCYTVQLAELVLGAPQSVTATGVLQTTDVDETSVITLTYPGNKMAVLTCSASCFLDNKAVISGSKGQIELVSPMWSPTEIIINGKTERFPLPEPETKLNFPNSEGFMYEAQHVRDMLLKGLLESSLMPHAASLNIITILDEARRQIGVVYDVDK